jgi:Protein of unknown function (DUF2934)
MQPAPSSSSELQKAIRLRAQQIYERGGRIPGHDIDHWRQAQAEILREYSTRGARKAIVINVEGVVYTGEYEAASAGGYKPGEWHAGDPVPVRFLENKMYIRRRNGKELETSIVKRIG